MHLYKNQFSEIHDFPRIEKPSKVLIIASTGRSGSHMLGHALHKTNRFGFPLEYVNPANLSEWKRLIGINNFHGVMTEIQQRRTSPNGVFGIKIHYPHIKQFGGFENMVKCFPNAYYILLYRKDILKQAVSLSIAQQTGVWISGQKPVNETPKYDFSHIDKCLRQTILDNSSWRYTLSASGCNYIEMEFNQVRYDLVETIKTIARFIEIEIPVNEIPNKQVTKKQSNNRNGEWARKFIADFDKSNELLYSVESSFIKRIKRRVKRMLHS